MTPCILFHQFSLYGVYHIMLSFSTILKPHFKNHCCIMASTVVYNSLNEASLNEASLNEALYISTARSLLFVSCISHNYPDY